MQRKFTLFVAAAMASGIAGWSYAEDAVTPDRNMDHMKMKAMDKVPSLPAGFVQKNLNEEKDIRSELGTLAEDAMTKSDLDGVLNNLVDQDRDRTKKRDDKDTTKLDGRIAQLQKAWKDKYGAEFDIDAEKAYTGMFAQIIQGEVSDPAVAVKNWPLAACDMKGMNPKMMQRDTDGETKKEEAKEMFGGDVNLDKGRNVALVHVAASHGLPALTVSMIHELPDQWRIDVPNDRTGEKIYQDLLTHLTYLGENPDKWPADVQDGYRAVTHHVLMALYGVPVDAADMMNKAAGKMMNRGK